MTKEISLKTMKKFGCKDWWYPQQDGPDGVSATDVGHVETATRQHKADLMVGKNESSGAVDVTKRVSQKVNSKDPVQSLSDTRSAPEVKFPGPKTQPITNNRDKSVWEHGGKERRKTGLREYAIVLAVDTNAVHRNLQLSDNNRKVTCVTEEQTYPDHPDRFDVYLQLLCSNGLTGRCYWEVEWRGWVEISVSYRGISRRGNSDDCRFGFNAQSWILECSDSGDGFSARHNNRRTKLSSSSVSNRVAVYVDCPAGTLSFYRVSSDKLIHLHTFNTTFTEPLYPGFGLLSPGSSVSLCVV